MDTKMYFDSVWEIKIPNRIITKSGQGVKVSLWVGMWICSFKKTALRQEMARAGAKVSFDTETTINHKENTSFTARLSD